MPRLVLLLPAQGPAGLEVEPLALVEHLRRLEQSEVARDGLPLNGYALDVVEVVDEVGQARRRAKVVDDVGHDPVEGTDVAHLLAHLDVLLDNLRDDPLDVGGLRLRVVIGERTGEPAVAQIFLELRASLAYGLAKKPLHSQVLVERERE